MKSARYEVYKGRDGWRWRLVARNGRIIAQGEGHTRRRDAERAADTVAATAGLAQRRWV